MKYIYIVLDKIRFTKLFLIYSWSILGWGFPYFFAVSINIGIRKWALEYNSFANFQFRYFYEIFSEKNLRSCWLSDWKSFLFQKSSQHFVWNPSEPLVAVAWGGSILVQEESTGGSFDQLPSQKNCQEIAPEKLPRNCTREIVKKLLWNWELRKVQRRMALMMKALILDLHKNMRE